MKGTMRQRFANLCPFSHKGTKFGIKGAVGKLPKNIVVCLGIWMNHIRFVKPVIAQVVHHQFERREIQ